MKIYLAEWDLAADNEVLLTETPLLVIVIKRFKNNLGGAC